MDYVMIKESSWSFCRKAGRWLLIEHGHNSPVTKSKPSVGHALKPSALQLCLFGFMSVTQAQYQMACSVWLVFEHLLVYGRWMHWDHGHHCKDLAQRAKYRTNRVSYCMLLQQGHLYKQWLFVPSDTTHEDTSQKNRSSAKRKPIRGRISSCGDDTNLLETMAPSKFPVVCAGGVLTFPESCTQMHRNIMAL